MTLLRVTAYKLVTDSTNGYERDVYELLNRIKTGKSKELVNQIRKLSKERANEVKKQLPGVCFNGTFKHRSKNGLKTHSGLIVLDFDNFATFEDAEAFKSEIIKDSFVFSSWVSPSGKGVKVLVRIPQDADNHKKYFEALKKHFNSDFWDDSGSDVSRFCFESYDPEIYINTDSAIWSKIEEEEVEQIGSVLVAIPLTSESLIIDRLLIWFNKKYGNTKGNRNNNIFKLAAAFSDFGIQINVAENELLKFAEGDFKGSEIIRTLKSAYDSGKNTFGSKFFEDEEKIEIIQKLIRGGKTQKEITEAIKDTDKETLEAYVSSVKEQMDINEYWYYNEKNQIRISIHKYKYWLQQNNFFKFYPEDKDGFTFVKVCQNAIEEVDRDKIKDFVLKDIEKRPDVGLQPYEFMAGNLGYFKSDFLSLLDPVKINFLQDTKDESFVYYKNKVLKVASTHVEEIDYIDLSGSIWNEQIIDRDFNYTDFSESEYRKFIWLVSGQDENKFNSFRSAIGFLLHLYKTSATNKAIILNDERISDTPNGGSGKGIFWKALQHIRKVDFLSGKDYNEKDKFKFQTAKKDTQIYVFDDVKKNFNFENLFNLITEGITLEYKGAGAINVEVEKSPKILITTNYTIAGASGSFERRIFELEFSSHFSVSYTPADLFKHELFKDWSSEEWNKFDSFMIDCLQYYLTHGLVKQQHENLETRKFIKSTCFEFYEWLESDNGIIETGREIPKSDAYAAFINEYDNLKFKVTNRQFTKWIDVYASFNNMIVEQGRNSVYRWFKLSKTAATKETIRIEDKQTEIPF